METFSQNLDGFVSASGQLRFSCSPDHKILCCSFGDIKIAGADELVAIVSAMGDRMKDGNIGRMCMDISTMRHFDIPVRMALLKSLKSIFFDKVPFLVLAVVKSKSVFENMTMQLAITASFPLSNKFIDSKMFAQKEEAIVWLGQSFKESTVFLK